MAFSASAQWQVINGGSDGTTGFGGGFDPGGCTFDATGAIATAITTPVLSSSNYNFVAGDIGAWAYLASGTNLIPGWYQIASVASNAATLTATIGSAQLLTRGLNTVAGCSLSGTSLSSISWTIDYSRQTTANITYTDLVIGASTTTFTSVAHPVAPNIIGNIIAVSSGTGFTVQRVQILSTATITATVDKTLGTTASTGGNGKLGGAFASTGQAGALALSSNGIWIKYNATPFTSTSTTSNVTVGRLTLQSGVTTAITFVRGYEVVCGDETVNRPTVKWGVNAASSALISHAALSRVENIIFDGNQANFTSTRALNPAANNNVFVRKCKFLNFNAGIFATVSGQNITIQDCEFTANITTALCAAGTAQPITFQGCSFYSNTASCITISSGRAIVIDCTFWSNTGAAVSNISMTGIGALWASNITMATVGLHGFDIQVAANTCSFTNCYVQGASTGWGFNFTTAMDTVIMYNCGGFNNSLGNYDATKLTNSEDQVGFIPVTADAFTTLASGILTLNNTNPGGAQLRAAGWPSIYPGLTGIAYPDVGSYQHQDPATSGTNIFNIME